MNSMRNEERETLSQRGLGSKTAAVTPYVQFTLPSRQKLLSPTSPAVPPPEPVAPASDDALVYGVGINDSQEGARDAAYIAWKVMMKRVYQNEPANPYPTYDDCSVDPCWHLYSDFKSWFDVNHIAGYELDKDILQPGNRLYSPDKCVYVPPYINQAVKWRRKLPNSGYPGVRVFAGLHHASIMHKGITTEGQSRKDALEAHCDWQKLKADSLDVHLQNYLKEVAPDLRVVRALIRYVDLLRTNSDKGIPTLKYHH